MLPLYIWIPLLLYAAIIFTIYVNYYLHTWLSLLRVAGIIIVCAYTPRGYTVRIVKSLSINDKFIIHILSTFYPHFIHNIHNFFCYWITIILSYSIRPFYRSVSSIFLLPSSGGLFASHLVAQTALALYLAATAVLHTLVNILYTI